jgi:hypothetical protein
MMHAPITESVRLLVGNTLVELGLSSGREPHETILIRDGNYCGRRFDSDDGHAIWFVEEEQIKFFRADGSLARVMDAMRDNSAPVQKAA